MNKLLLLCFLSFFSTQIIAQNCATDMIHEHKMTHDVEYQKGNLKLEKQIQQAYLTSDLQESNNLLTIPIVFHVIHRGEAIGEGTNISEQDIYNALLQLNDNFNGGIIPGPVGNIVDTEIEFCLATRDPQGNPTSGINRADGSGVPDYSTIGIQVNNSPGANVAAIKDLSRWPTDEYYNVWVVSDLFAEIGGFASLPNGNVYDGTVIQSNLVSSPIFTHEVGHGFNLRHTFLGQGNNGTTCPENTDCSTQGDFVCDTPPHRENDCTTSPCFAGDISNSSYNFMGYCGLQTLLFTQGQKDRMRAALQVQPRLSLLSSSGCSLPSIATCSDGIQNQNEEDVDCGGVCSFSCYGEQFCASQISGFTTLGQFDYSTYYLSNNTFTPEQAQTHAESVGGYLVRVNDFYENNFISQNISESAYIALNDQDLEGVLTNYGNPISSAYTNIDPCNSCNANSNELDFVIVAPDGTMSFTGINDEFKYILEIPCDGRHLSELTFDCSDLYFTLPAGETFMEITYDDPTAATTTCPLGGDITIDFESGLLPFGGTIFPAGEYFATYTARDQCDNIVSCTFSIFIEEDNGGGGGGDCPQDLSGFTSLGEFGDSKYFLSDDFYRPTDAQVVAEAQGGYLVAINSQAENDFIQQNISEMVYIGLTDENTEGTMEWFNGETLTYNNIDPCGFCNENSANMDYVIMAPWNGAWSFSNFFNSRKYVIEIPCDGSTTNAEITINCPSDLNLTLPNGATQMPVSYNIPTATTTCSDGGLEVVRVSGVASGELLAVGNYTITYEATDNCGVVETCSFSISIQNGNTGGGGCPDDIAGFTSLGEYEDSKYFISDDISRPTDAQAIAEAQGGYLVTINTQAENDFIQQNISEMVYIGLTDENTEGTLQWYNGEALTYNNIDPCGFCNENSANMDYVIMAPWNGAWSFSNFYNSRKYVIEIPCDGNTGGSYITVNNCSDDETLMIAPGETEAQISYFPPQAYTDCVDGGLSILKTSGPFSGESRGVGTYTVVYEISDACGNSETCSFTFTIVDDNNTGGGGDCPSMIPNHEFLGEFGNSKYFISNDIARAPDAQIICENNGGYLVTISSQAENDFIQQNISEMVYLGLHDENTEGTIEWFNGDAVTYNNLDPCSFCNENSENMDYAIMAGWDGKWSWSNFWNQRRYILEVPCNSVAPITTIPNENILTENKLKLSTLMPNPASEFIRVQIKSSQELDVMIQIFDTKGNLVKENNQALFEGINGVEMDISQLPAGMYWVRIPEQQGQDVFKRFVKIER